MSKRRIRALQNLFYAATGRAPGGAPVYGEVPGFGQAPQLIGYVSELRRIKKGHLAARRTDLHPVSRRQSRLWQHLQALAARTPKAPPPTLRRRRGASL